mgnify:CR=1 FL=1
MPKSAYTPTEGRPHRGATIEQTLKMLPPEDIKALAATADSLGMDPNLLYAMIHFESAGTFDPAVREGTGESTATGIIQFVAPTARELGVKGDSVEGIRGTLSSMSFQDQLDLTAKYFIQRGWMDLSPKERVGLSGQDHAYATIHGGNPKANAWDDASKMWTRDIGRKHIGPRYAALQRINHPLLTGSAPTQQTGEPPMSTTKSEGPATSREGRAAATEKLKGLDTYSGELWTHLVNYENELLKYLGEPVQAAPISYYKGQALGPYFVRLNELALRAGRAPSFHAAEERMLTKEEKAQFSPQYIERIRQGILGELKLLHGYEMTDAERNAAIFWREQRQTNPLYAPKVGATTPGSVDLAPDPDPEAVIEEAYQAPGPGVQPGLEEREAEADKALEETIENRLQREYKKKFLGSPANRGQLMHGFEPFGDSTRPEDMGPRPTDEELARLKGESRGTQ